MGHCLQVGKNLLQKTFKESQNMMAWLLFVLLFIFPLQQGVFSSWQGKGKGAPKCNNPKGKLWDSVLDKDCGQSVCKKGKGKGNKGVWEQCPRPATHDDLQELEKTLLNAVKMLEEKIEQCGYQTQTPFWDERTTMFQPPLGSKLFYEEKGAKYYGIPVAKGVTLNTGVVADTCDAAGMRAVCNGDSSCHNYSPRCEVVDLETFPGSCGNPMWGLAKKLCGEDKNARKCPQMNGLFNFMPNWSGECGIVDGVWCARGNALTPGNPPVYYAYCIQGIDKPKHQAKMSDVQTDEMIGSDSSSARDQMTADMIEGGI